MKQIERHLLEKLESSPSDLDLLNEIAIFYSENIALGFTPDYQDIQYFEKAYKIKKTIKSMHNLAFYTFFEDRSGEAATSFEELVNIQQECLALNPKSHMPYELYAYFMLENSNYEEAGKYYELAIEKGATSFHVFHNLGVVCFFMKNFLKSKEYLKQSLKIVKLADNALYNLAIVYMSMGKKNESICILKDLEKLIDDPKNKCCAEVDYLDLSILYFSLGNYQKSSELALKSEYGFDFISYKEVAFSLYMENTAIYKERREGFITENKKTIFEIRSNIEGWEDETENEKKLSVKEAMENINKYQKMTSDFKNTPPKANFSEYMRTEYCECLLFGCKTHGNPEND